MKNSTLVLFFVAVLLLLVLPLSSNAQEVSPEISKGFFSKIGSWAQNSAIAVVASIFGAFLAKMGWIPQIKAWLRRGALITKELGEVSGDLSSAMTTLEAAIREDGKIPQNSIAELIKEGKQVKVSAKDMVIIFKPVSKFVLR